MKVKMFTHFRKSGACADVSAFKICDSHCGTKCQSVFQAVNGLVCSVGIVNALVTFVMVSACLCFKPLMDLCVRWKS